MSLIGPYELLEELGRGGMGVVYSARRADGQFDRKVAIKVLHPGADSDEIAARFERERQVLAALEHPGIARLIDGGVAEDGRPYLVMEYVGGVPIDRWCEEGRLTVAARLELFRRVCAAVDAAHRSLVVHRDLKPDNVLVDRNGRPRLLDFGIAKILDPERQAASSGSTRTVAGWSTPTYASPEQHRGDPITTASDTYSLGVILYQILTGRLPLELEGLSAGEAEQVVCEVEPPAPSEAVGDSKDLARELAGDLDTVVGKALHKEATHRYASAAELAEDLRRYASGHPVSAERDTWGYRAKRFVGRNRAVVTAAVAVWLVLVVGIASSTWQYTRADSARRDLSHQIDVDRERARELKARTEQLERSTQEADDARIAAEENAERLEALTEELEEAKVLVDRERGRAEESLAEVSGLNVELERQEALARRRYQNTRDLTRALVFDVQEALAPLDGADRAMVLVTDLGLRSLDRLARDPNADPASLREVADGYLRLASASKKKAPPGAQGGVADLCSRTFDAAERLYDSAPDDVEVRRHFARILRELGRLERERGLDEPAEEHLEWAAEIEQELEEEGASGGD